MLFHDVGRRECSFRVGGGGGGAPGSRLRASYGTRPNPTGPYRMRLDVTAEAARQRSSLTSARSARGFLRHTRRDHRPPGRALTPRAGRLNPEIFFFMDDNAHPPHPDLPSPTKCAPASGSCRPHRHGPFAVTNEGRDRIDPATPRQRACHRHERGARPPAYLTDLSTMSGTPHQHVSVELGCHASPHPTLGALPERNSRSDVSYMKIPTSPPPRHAFSIFRRRAARVR